MDLHDSPIHWAHYLPHRRRLEFALDLCAWRQPDYVAGNPELVAGVLVFFGVSALHLDATNPNLLTRTGWSPRGGHFLSATPKGSGYRLVFEVEREGEPRSDVCLLDLEFEGSYFEPR